MATTKPHRPPAATQRHCGFTLVELLVVITVISILVAMLLPSVKQAKQEAQSVVCQSRLRQVGMFIFMYQSDYHGVAPPGTGTMDSPVTGLPVTVTWMGMLCVNGYCNPAPMVKSRKNVFLCPSNKPGWWTQAPPPSKPTAWNMNQGFGIRHYSSTEMRPWTIGQNKVRMLPWNNLGSDNFGPPSEFLFMGDTLLFFPAATGHLGQTSLFDPASGVYPVASMGVAHVRHNKRGNFLFGDGAIHRLGISEMDGNFGDTSASHYGKFAAKFIFDDDPYQ